MAVDQDLKEPLLDPHGDDSRDGRGLVEEEACSIHNRERSGRRFVIAVSILCAMSVILNLILGLECGLSYSKKEKVLSPLSKSQRSSLK